MPIEKPSTPRAETVTEQTIAEDAKRLNELTWKGDYERALPLADAILQFRTESGEREAALVQYASSYYSAASRLWKDSGVKAAPKVGARMNTALRALQERVEDELQKQGGKKEGLVPVSLDALPASELDVMQAVYRRAGEMADSVPLVKPLREMLLTKEQDPVRDFDAAALLAIRAGLKKAKEGTEAPHTEIFLLGGAFAIAKRYGWEGIAQTRAERLFALAERYPWPPESLTPEETDAHLAVYGQAARVARHAREVARALGDAERASEYEEKARTYAAFVPDQQSKLA